MILRAPASALRILHGGPGPIHTWADVYAAVANAGMFNMADGSPVGALVEDRHVYQRYPRTWPLLIVRGGVPQIVRGGQWREYWDLDHCEAAVSCAPMLVWEGRATDLYREIDVAKISVSDLRPTSRTGRTAIGLTADGDVLLGVWESETLPGVQQAMLAAGAAAALALDGGGSSVLYRDGKRVVGDDVRQYPSAIALTKVLEGSDNTPQEAKDVGFDVVVQATDDPIGRYFKLREFACPTCGYVRVNPGFIGLVARLDAMRAEAGVPCRVTSGYRCPEHNREVAGAADDSRHMEGDGADIVLQGLGLDRMRALAEKYFADGGIGVYQDGHIHVDLGPKRRW